MSEKAKIIADYLQKEYGITSPEELLKAVEADRGVPVGIFTSKAERRGKNIEAF